MKFSLEFGRSAGEDSWLLRLDPRAVSFFLQTSISLVLQIQWLDGPSIFIKWQIFHFAMTKYEKKKIKYQAVSINRDFSVLNFLFNVKRSVI